MLRECVQRCNPNDKLFLTPFQWRYQVLIKHELFDSFHKFDVLSDKSTHHFQSSFDTRLCQVGFHNRENSLCSRVCFSQFKRNHELHQYFQRRCTWFSHFHLWGKLSYVFRRKYIAFNWYISPFIDYCPVYGAGLPWLRLHQVTIVLLVMR